MNQSTSEWKRAARPDREGHARPVHEIRFGHIKAAVWRNETENGVRYSATFGRLYRDGEQWKTTESFYRDDLLLLAKTADAVHSWIFAQSQEENDTAGRGPQGPPHPSKAGAGPASPGERG